MFTVQNVKGFYIVPRIKIERPRDKMLYLFLCEKANFIDSELCSRGELITSKIKLEQETGWSYSKIRGSIKRLEDLGLIKTETLPMKSGTKILIVDYSLFQDLTNYKNMTSILRYEEIQADNKPNTHESSNQIVPKKQEISREEEGKGSITSKPNNYQNSNEKLKQSSDTITKAFNKIFKQNEFNIKENKGFSCLSKVFRNSELFLQSYEDTAQFVENVVSNDFPFTTINQEIFMDYLESIRLARNSEKVSVVTVVNFLAEIENYRVDIVESAFDIHRKGHRDKKESYTKGIMKNLIEVESSKIKPKDVKPRVSNKTRKREERLKAKGLLKSTGNLKVDF
ncbi:hypothetical protein [Fictibacillus phosphorivorans]|uniref:hypothetical protein n=1 Tax=Fictibacillus phosphorivorans TaxID=1221500 RepID=UPI00203D326F|nr:hypothetical protein [Fictibacillus phosphorivorans]MCM3718101.1 hypothetical protein [Fictibacillus phosphorivorans]MCM3775728.1 hypothetical protein [Fictibacillus phosphorivorans]